jgi:hypothetical protein
MSDVSPSDGSQSREGPPSGDTADSRSLRTSDGTAVVIPSTPPSDGSQSRPDTASAIDRQPADDGADDPEPVDDRLTVEQLREQVLAARRAEKRAERELGRFRKADQARADAEKSELERASERAETAERRLAEMERAELAKDIAREAGIPALWQRLSGVDSRSLRADALRLREELTALGTLPQTPGMDGGVRSLGNPPAPSRFEDMIRGSAGRR